MKSSMISVGYMSAAGDQFSVVEQPPFSTSQLFSHVLAPVQSSSHAVVHSVISHESVSLQ